MNLTKIQTIKVPAIKNFDLKKLSSDNKRVKIGYVSPDLESLGSSDSPACSVTISSMNSLARFDQTWAELDNPGELTLGQIYWLIEEGKLRTDGWSELFKVDSSLVSVGWRGDGWRFNVYPFGDDSEWDAGYQVIFRDSDTPSLKSQTLSPSETLTEFTPDGIENLKKLGWIK